MGLFEQMDSLHFMNLQVLLLVQQMNEFDLEMMTGMYFQKWVFLYDNF